jgi:SPX domain protein involved in polyphosphate accumulation
MMQDLVKRRVEIKHLLSPSAAPDVHRRLRAADPGTDAKRISGRVVTTYLDLPDRRLTRAVLDHPEENLKLRIREYLSEQGTPVSPFVWVEMKEREGEISRKSRFRLHKRLLAKFLDGGVDLGEVLTCQSDPFDVGDVVQAVQEIHMVAEGPLSPIGTVRYRRDSIQGGDPAARVTLDEEITYFVGTASWTEGSAVVEVKHSGERPPSWCRAVVGPGRASEYSKFLVLARLSMAEAPAA